MALHGDVKVNGLQIGQWVAVRRELEPAADPAPNSYDVQVMLTETPHQVAAHHHLVIHHMHSDGAVALVARIFAEVADLQFDSNGWVDEDGRA